MNKKLQIISIFMLIAIFALASCSQKASANANSTNENNNEILKKGESMDNNEHLFIETNLGTIEIEFYPDKAPNHVAAIKKLASEGFYDGTKFHRVIPGFMIQGGDPNSKSDDKSMHGMGGPGFNINAEFNDISHKRGIASMARSQHPDSAGSQFFIMVADGPFLDGQYTVWGNVVSGMDIADKIVASPRDANDNPNTPVIMNKVYVK